MRLPVELFVLVCVVIGLAPNLVAGALVESASASVLARDVHVHFALWHGFNAALAMSLVAVFAGVGWYVLRRDTARTALPPRLGRSASEIYDEVVRGLLAGAKALTDALQTGSLRRYVIVTLGVAIALALSGLARHGSGETAAILLTAPPPGAAALTALTAVVCVMVAALYRRRWPSLLGFGAAGLFVALYFTWLSAPDLVLTQILVESVTTILLVLVLYFLPKEGTTREPRPRLVRDAAFSVVAGGAVAAVVLSVLRRPFESISAYHIENSLPQAGGGNVVNVILVDFRGFDTLGEITVLGIAAVGVMALVHAGRKSR